MWRRRNERGSLGWFEFRTRAGVYVLLAAVPVLAVVLAAGQRQVRGPGLAVFLLLSVAQAGVCIALLHAGLGRYLAAGPPPGRWLVASAAALTAAGVLAGAAAFPAFTQPPGTAFPVSMLVAMLFSGALILALTPLLSLRALTALVLVSAAAASGLTASIGRAGAGPHGDLLVAAALVYTFIVGVGVLTCRSSASTLRIMSELDRSRTAHARLSVAEERLRFARDLHDVLGRNLSLIAVQSELAAELARRGDQDAAGQMLQVRQVAHESLREMRAVVSGYRTADLGTELAGAQEVLRSAGMSCRVTGDAAGLPADVQAALGWVVREGTTNIIRHSDATACTIELAHPGFPGRPARGDAPHGQRPRAHAGRRIWRQRAGRARRAAGRPGRQHHHRASPQRPLPAGGQPARLRRRSGAARPGPARHRCQRRDARAVIRVLLADDENLIRTALASLLAIQDDLEVVAQAASGDEALAMARRHRPDVAVLDLQMPGLDGIAVAGQLVTELPACGSLILTSYGRPGHLKRALAAGVRGFLPKTVSAQVLADVVRTVHRGGRYVDPELAADAISAGDSPLTPREADVLELAAGGAPVDEIARRAALTPGTVRNYLSSAAAKLGAANRHEAVQLARSRGWI